MGGSVPSVHPNVRARDVRQLDGPVWALGTGLSGPDSGMAAVPAWMSRRHARFAVAMPNPYTSVHPNVRARNILRARDDVRGREILGARASCPRNVPSAGADPGHTRCFVRPGQKELPTPAHSRRGQDALAPGFPHVRLARSASSLWSGSASGSPMRAGGAWPGPSQRWRRCGSPTPAGGAQCRMSRMTAWRRFPHACGRGVRPRSGIGHEQGAPDSESRDGTRTSPRLAPSNTLRAWPTHQRRRSFTAKRRETRQGALTFRWRMSLRATPTYGNLVLEVSVPFSSFTPGRAVVRRTSDTDPWVETRAVWVMAGYFSHCGGRSSRNRQLASAWFGAASPGSGQAVGGDAVSQRNNVLPAQWR